jgi:HEAT repeat protein
MFDFLGLRVDRLSFWLGFLTASLMWWLLGRLRPLLPIWRDQIRHSLNAARQRNLAGVEAYLRRDALRLAQHQHLAAPLFALDEILIQPWLIAPPPEPEPGTQGPPQSIAGQVTPYLPDSPEITAPLGIARLTPLQAAQNGRHIAIIGQPGAGKTVALSHLASVLARQNEAAGKLAGAIPILVHVLDLNVRLEVGDDPLERVIQAAAGRASLLIQRQFPRFLRAVMDDSQRRVVLLLDGLDEIPLERLVETVTFLTALHHNHPRLQTIVTASADHLDGLTRAGFLPLGVIPWSRADRAEATHRWGALWQAHLAPEILKNAALPEIDPALYDYWLDGETAYATPLEWTLRLWGAYAGDLSGSRAVDLLEAYVTRFLPGPGAVLALKELARQMLLQRQVSLGFAEMEKILTQSGMEQAALPVTGENPSQPVLEGEPAAPADAKKTGKRNRRDLVASRGEQAIDSLVQGGVLVEHVHGQLRFRNPVVLGFLAGMRFSAADAAGFIKDLNWAVASLALQYAAACGGDSSWILPLIETPTAPLFRDLLAAARWLRDAPPQAAWRSKLMRALVSLIQVETLPLSIRARLVGAFFLSRDPSTPRLFKQLLASRSPITRRAALLGCGALGNPQLIHDVLELLADLDPQVRYTACLALAAIPGEAALTAIGQVLLSGDEDLRQAAAEALARNKAEGHQALQDAAGLDDLLVRRAAVFGLLQVGEPWAQQLLEKMAVEDAQWVVRNAAAQALDTLQQTDQAIPRLPPPPSESPWLLTFASKLGKGIQPGQPATDVLLMALKSGSVEEQAAALTYLRDQPDEGVIQAIYHLVYGEQPAACEPAIQALWWMAISGAALPDSRQFGLG